MINSSKMDRRITVVSPPTIVKTGLDQAATAGASKVIWGSANRLSEYISLSYGLEQGISGYEFKFRYNSVLGITLKHTLVYMGRNFTIQKIFNVDENNEEVKVVAYERAT